MASNVITLTNLQLDDPDNGRFFTIYVPEHVRDLCNRDTSGVLANSVFEKIVAKHTKNGMPKEKTLDYTESLAIISEMNLLTEKTEPAKSSSGLGLQVSSMPDLDRVSPSTTLSSGESQQDPEPDPDFNMEEANESEEQGRVTWTHEAILLLVDRRRELAHLFESNTITQRQAWRKVAEELAAKGYRYSENDCSKKFRSLRARYKTIKEKHGQTGSGRITWRYFEILDEMFSGDPAVLPTTVVASMQLEKGSRGQPVPTLETETLNEPAAGLFNSPPPSSRKRRRVSSESVDPPQWVLAFQEKQQKMHEERMELEKRRVIAIESLVRILQDQ